MMRSGNQETVSKKIFTIVLSVAIIGMLVWGVVSIAKNGKTNVDSKNNLVDLNVQNTTKAPDYAFHTEKTTSNNESIAKKNEETTVARTEKESVANEVTKTSEKVNEVGNVKVQTKYVFNESDDMTWPVKGGILLNYSMDRTIWFSTLEQYKCNSGLVIGAALGSDVIVAASGVVESIEETKEYGTVITVDIGNGYKTIYGQINNSKKLKAGNTVIEGQVLATVNKTTSYFSKEGDNVFFKVTKDGNPVNPMDYLE